MLFTLLSKTISKGNVAKSIMIKEKKERKKKRKLCYFCAIVCIQVSDRDMHLTQVGKNLVMSFKMQLSYIVHQIIY